MFIKFRTLLLFVVLLSACAPAAPAISATHTPGVPSAAATPSTAPAAPAENPNPEPTATQPLPAHGPNFSFLTGDVENIVLTLLGPDAAGRKEIRLTSLFQPGNCLSCAVSPDGGWIAYWTGYAGDETTLSAPNPKGPFNLRLHLLHISEGTETVIAPLLSPDYPANFEKNAAAIKNLPGYNPDDSFIQMDLIGSFLSDIRSAAWSPDSRYLAFAGGTDGPSSDLYVYDVAEKTILRLSDCPTNILSGGGPAIRWSPDGKWIVYSAGIWVGEGMRVKFFAARPDGSDSREYPEEVTSFAGWLSDSAFLVTQNENGVGTYRLESNDLETGRVSVIWNCQYSNFAFDPGNSVLVFQTYPNESDAECRNAGLYFRSPPAGSARRVTGLEKTELFTTVDFLGMGDLRYLVTDSELDAYSVSPAGESALLTSEGLFPYVAPDRLWVVFAGKGFRIMDSSGNLSARLTERSVGNVFWRPDSKGFLFASGSDLYSVSLSEKTVSKMEGIPYPSDAEMPYWRPDSQGYFFKSGSGLYFLSLRDRSLTFIQGDINPYFFDPVWVAVPK